MPALPLLYRRAATAARTASTFSSSSFDHPLLAAREHVSQLLQTLAARLSTLSQHLTKRASPNCPSGIIANCYAGLNAGPAPGAVAGIVIGSVAGFVLLLYILWILSQGTDFIRTSAVEEEEIVVRRAPREHRRRRSSAREATSTYREEVRERSPRRESVIRQERIVRDIPPSRQPSRVRETLIVEERGERRVEGDDIVEVIEEHDSYLSGAPPPRRQSSRRGSRYW